MNTVIIGWTETKRLVNTGNMKQVDLLTYQFVTSSGNILPVFNGYGNTNMICNIDDEDLPLFISYESFKTLKGEENVVNM